MAHSVAPTDIRQRLAHSVRQVLTAYTQSNRCDRRSIGPLHPAGVPGHVRSDNGPEFVAEAVQAWITAVGAKTAYIERGSPWENGYVESFNARLRDELLDGEIFYTLREA
jgi:transposase InsO family protein